ncbi:PQQ-dependent sugar dehydrogenase [Microvirga zambiensis]|uniref:PQQ-dependent sugar dehydrogenase n=1 Tax=Microvirga zambiensis TaxID=1402137 RepID=UPI00191FB040|nr:PQQ-dependent sugar dehydrogenase [Microvirga zambiensis]
MAVYWGTSGSDTYSGTSEADTIYGYPEALAPSSVIASGLYRPLFATAPTGDTDRLFVVSQGGTIKIHDLNDPQATPKTFLDISSKVNNNTEAGLLGFTFHPDFATNGKCYVNYTTPDQPDGSGRKQAIVEYTFDPTDLSKAPTEKTIMVIDYPQQNTHHRAGWLGFGPDSMLYIATGEDTVATNAQTVVNANGTINHLGKMLRIDVSGDGFPADEDRNYRIPTDNPTEFANIVGELPQPSEIWAVGLRNPWRASFGPDGTLYVADVGQNTYEEINIVKAGENYGWRPTAVGDGPQNIPGYTDPYHYYGRDVGGSVTGGYFYSGQGSLNGKYIFGDFNVGKIFAMDVSGTSPDVDDVTNLFRDQNGIPLQFGHLSSFGLDGQGRLYAISYADNSWGNDTGRIFRLSDNTPVPDEGDTLNGAEGNDTIYGGGGNDIIRGGDDDDHIYGGTGNDIMYGDAGADTLEGGEGDDIYYVDSDDTIAGESAADDDNDFVGALGSFVLQSGQEIEILQADDSESEISLDLTGNEFAQSLIGNAGMNRLDGKGGADKMEGLRGNDTYVVDNAGDEIIEAANEGADTVESTIDFSLSAKDSYGNLEHLTLLGTAMRATGNTGANVITGNDVANELDGATGQDTLKGGDGNDTYFVYGHGETIEEFSGKGTDTVVIRGSSFMLADNVDIEILRADGTREVTDIIGNNLANRIYGNSGANRIDGGGGNDEVVFTGNRSDYTIERREDGSFILQDNRGTGGDGADTIFNVEIFTFNDGSVTAGNLTNPAPTGILIDTDVVDENSAAGKAVGTFTAEDMEGDTHVFALTDDAGGRFTIDTATGALKVADGVRLDYEQATSHSITVRVTDGAGASISRTLAITVRDVLNESATGSTNGDRILGGNGLDTFSGGAGDDTLDGSTGHDLLNGDAGNDSLIGGVGNDVLNGGADNDTLNGDADNDTLNGDAGNDFLFGGAGNDLLSAGDGNDRIIGGLGKDTLTGGKGKDVFVFDDKETGSSKSKADYITDFKGKEGDRIDLKLVDADSRKKGDQKFSFIGDKAFTKAGQVRVEKTKKETFVYLNTDSDKAAEAVIKLKGSIDLSKGWFVL